MQNVLVAIILAMVVAGIIVPALMRDIKDTRETFQRPKPESAFIRLLKMMKDKLKND